MFNEQKNINTEENKQDLYHLAEKRKFTTLLEWCVLGNKTKMAEQLFSRKKRKTSLCIFYAQKSIDGGILDTTSRGLDLDFRFKNACY